MAELWGLSVGNEMGNNNTTDLREEESAANEPPEKSSPGSVLEDDKIIENQLVSTGKVDSLEDVTELPGHTDVSDKILDKREQPEAPPGIAVKGGQAEDDEKLKAIPARSPGNNGNISGDYVRVRKDEHFASTDLTTKDFLEHETSLDSASDLKEASIAMERSNDIPQVSNLMENAKMKETEYLSNVSADLVPETIFKHVEEAEEMGLESSEAPHLEGNRMEEMTMRLKDIEFLDGDEGMLTEKKVTELDRDGPVSEVEEGDTDGCRNGMSDEIKRTLASNEPNHIQARPDELPVLDHASSTEREEPEVSMEIATKGGQVEDCEEQRAIPTSSSTDYGNSLGSWVQVEMDDRFASTDPTTKDSLEPETSVDSESDPEETSITTERSNDGPQELNSMESGNKQDSRFSRDLRADFVPQTIPEPIKRDEEMELENGEVLHLEGNQKEEVGDMEFPCADEGISAETKVTESDINVLASVVEEGETDDRNGLFDQMNYVTTLLDVHPFQCENVGQCQVETGYLSIVSADFIPETIFEHVEEAEEMGLENSEVPHIEGNQMEELTMRLKDIEFLGGDEGTLTEKKMTESDRDEPVSEVEEDDTDGCRIGMSDEMKGTLASNELNRIQARPDEVLVLDHASNTGREEPKVSMEIATRGGQVEDYEEQRAIPTNSSTDYGNSPSCCVQVEMDDQFASTDPNTKDSPEPETSVDSASDPEEAQIAMERSNDVPQELNVMENGNKQDSRFSRDLTPDFDAQTVPEPIKRAEEMELENGEVLHLDGNQMEKVAGMELPCADEGISAETKVTESDINVPASVAEEVENDGQNGLFDQMNYVTTLSDVRAFQSGNVEQCQDEAELVTVNSFEVNDSSEASQSDGVDGHQEEEESTVKNILLDEKEAMEAPFLVGDETVDGEEASELFIPSPEAGIFDDEESQSSVSSSSTVPNSEATVSDFEFEKPRMDLPEIPGTSFVFMVEAKAPENGGEDRFPRSEISGILNSDSISNNIFPGMQKSPSFDLDFQSESDQTPLLFQDKAEIVIPTLQEQEKAVTAERSDSEKSKAPLLWFTEREENEGEEAKTASKPRKEESQGGKEKAVVRVKERRSFGSLLFGNCICCGTDRLEYPSV